MLLVVGVGVVLVCGGLVWGLVAGGLLIVLVCVDCGRLAGGVTDFLDTLVSCRVGVI